MTLHKGSGDFQEYIMVNSGKHSVGSPYEKFWKISIEFAIWRLVGFQGQFEWNILSKNQFVWIWTELSVGSEKRKAVSIENSLKTFPGGPAFETVGL